MRLALSDTERADLERLLRATSTPAGIARRARCILLLGNGASYAAVCATLAVTDRFVAQWKQRYRDGGILALADAPRAGRQDHRLTPAVEARIIRITREERPPTPLTHWTAPRVAARVGVSRSTVLRVWHRARLQPQRLERYVTTTDPQFEQKAADIIGLYLAPPDHAVVLCVDEKTAIQALDREDPVLPLSPGRAERHGFEYYRHGTLSLYAAFNTKTGEVLGKTAERHTSAEFVAFLTDIVAHQPRGKEIHVIADNLSAHKTKQVEQFLLEHANVHMHFTPTYSSWLNQVELWFGKIERDVIARGVFTSVPDLQRKLMRYIRQYNKQPKPVKWKYFDPSRRIASTSNVTVH